MVYQIGVKRRRSTSALEQACITILIAKCKEQMMKKYISWQQVCVGVLLGVFTAASVHAHGDGVSSGDLTSVAFVPNPNVPEFANAKGTLLINLSEGVLQLTDLQGFPFDTARNRILPANVTSTTDPRLKGHDGEPGNTSCEPASTHAHTDGEGEEHEEPVGPWTCHVHSYVVWLAELEDGTLGHPLPVGSIYPRTDGTAADRNFSFREGDLTGFGANVVIITAEVTFGAQQSLLQGHDGSTELQLAPLGPIVLQANLP